MCQALARLDRADMPKLAAAVTMSKPEYAMQVQHLAEQLDLFDFAPGTHSAADYGKHMIMDSGHYEYDENLVGYIDFARYGAERMEQEQGQFVDRGYVAYQGTLRLDELMRGDPAENMGPQLKIE